jgi:hypothetical protein
MGVHHPCITRLGLERLVGLGTTWLDKSAWLSEILAWRPPVLASLRRRSLTIRVRGSHSPCEHSELLAAATALGTPPYGFGLEASERTRS